MNICLICQQIFLPKINLLDILSLKKPSYPQLCTHCLEKFELLSESRCSICDRNSSEQIICEDCQTWQKKYSHNILRNHAIYRYNSAFHDLMVNYKRYGDYELNRALRALIKDKIRHYQFDYYIPIPTSPEHQAKRQFDTIYEIFDSVFELTPFLKKIEGSGAQGEKNKIQRLKAKQSFYLDQKIVKRVNINHKKVLLLDDIYTTGKTLYNARDKLLETFPQARIESFTICR